MTIMDHVESDNSDHIEVRRFHVRDGWEFTRFTDGAVAILNQKRDVLFVMNAEAWASVIATMSLGDEIDERFYAALVFHSSEGAIEIVTPEIASAGRVQRALEEVAK